MSFLPRAVFPGCLLPYTVGLGSSVPSLMFPMGFVRSLADTRGIRLDEGKPLSRSCSRLRLWTPLQVASPYLESFDTMVSGSLESIAEDMSISSDVGASGISVSAPVSCGTERDPLVGADRCFPLDKDNEWGSSDSDTEYRSEEDAGLEVTGLIAPL